MRDILECWHPWILWVCRFGVVEVYKALEVHVRRETFIWSKTDKLTWFAAAGLQHFGKAEATVEEVQAYLEDIYCGHLSVETGQLGTLEEREWFADRFEELKNQSFSTEERRQLAKLMLESQVGPMSFFLLFINSVQNVHILPQGIYKSDRKILLM